MAGKKIYISSHIYVLYCKDDTSLQYAVTYNTLQVVVYPTNNRYLGILRLRWGWGGGGGGMHIIFQVFMLIVLV